MLLVTSRPQWIYWHSKIIIMQNIKNDGIITFVTIYKVYGSVIY